MTTLKNSFRKICLAGLLLPALALLGLRDVHAQTEYLSENIEVSTFGGVKEYQDLIIPTDVQASYLYLEVNGGDGGKRSKGTSDHPGGEGATLSAFFEIGTGAKQIQPGSTIRLIPGKNGRSAESAAGSSAGAGGGGGSGVLLLNPGETDWYKSTILMVAGGGGGAGQFGSGQPGSTGEKGTAGRGSTGDSNENAGDIGKPGDPTNNSSGGDSALIDAEPTSDAKSCAGVAIAFAGFPEGGAGADCYLRGGWGFGGGGSGNTGGGGGGGYSGGGGGSNGGGGGGGSFLTGQYTTLHVIKDEGTHTYSSSDGYVDFGLVDLPPFQSAANTQKCLDLYKGITDNGTNIQLYECTGRSPQQWVLDGVNIRLFKDMDKCVNLKDGDMDKGLIQLRDCYEDDDKARQYWIYDGFSGAFRSGKNLDYCLDLENGSTANDTDVQVVRCTGSNTQQWQMEGATLVASKSGVKTIHLASDTDMCLDLYKGDTDNSTSEVQLYQCTGRSPQQWVFDGFRIKYNQDPEKCVNLDAGDTSNGTKIKVRDCYDPDDKARQHWIYDGANQTFRSGKNVKKCLTVVNDENKEATTFENDLKVKLYDCNGLDAQRWVIED